jgi:16S rRNA processing protein RimM
MGGEEFVVIGQVGRPHGLKGEVKVSLLTDFPERFEENDRFLIRFPDAHTEWMSDAAHRWQGNNLLIRFEGTDSREAAEKLRGATVEIERSACHELPEGEFYIADLIGLRVRTEQGDRIGVLKDVIQQGLQDLYLVQNGSREIFIPAVREFVTKIDLETGEIVINPIEGLLD